uniref:Uncharacterized protein n=1 Tax=Glossina pallidipes TaxID=7398 RepID=A0A1B0A9L9_GLOPL
MPRTTTTTEMKHNTSVLCSGNIITGVQFRLAWCYEANFQVSSAMMLPLLLGNDAIAASAVVDVYIVLVCIHILLGDFEINIASVKRMCKCLHDMRKYVRISVEWNALKNFIQE